MLPASSRLTSVLGLPSCLHLCSSINHSIHMSTASATSAVASGSAAHTSSAQHDRTVNARTQKGRPRYSPAVIAYFQKVKEWNKQMSLLKTQWRAELLTQLQQQQQQQRVILQPSTSQHQQQQGVATAEQQQGVETAEQRQQLQQSLSSKLRRAEINLALAQIKLHKAHKFKQWQDRIEARSLQRRQALLEASRHWIRREELEERIIQALDNPAPFGFVSPMPDATKAL